MRFFHVTLVTLLFSLVNIQFVEGQVTVEARIGEKLAADGYVSCILVYPPLLIKDKIPGYLDKEEKGRMAYDLLKSYMERQSAPVIGILRSEGIDYRVNVLSSTINVTKCPEKIMARLLLQDQLRAILYNYSFGNLEDETDEAALDLRDSYTWGLAITKTNLVHEMGFRGAGAVIGGSDTGFDWTHPAITGRYRGYHADGSDHNYNWHDAIHEVSPLSNQGTPNPCGLSLKYPCDDNSHGTHTMGTMVGVVSDTTIIGMAPEAKWIATRNMERGNGSLQAYIEALDWFLAPTDTNDLNPDPSKAPHVINNSWYCNEEEGCNQDNWNIMQTSIANLKAAGIVVVASAGNSGPGCGSISFVPGMLDEVFSVGATDQVDTIAGFSSRGPVSADGSMRLKPDISAPGVGVYSSVLNHGYSYYSGTSMAGPHVAGLVALMVGANPSLAGQVDTIQEIIKRTADPLTLGQDCNGFSGLEVPNPIYGYGRINALRAVEAAVGHVMSRVDRCNVAGLEIYPNPVRSELILRNVDGHLFRSVEILDINGKVLRQLNGEESYGAVDVSGLIAGTYIIRAVSSTGSYIQKFVKSN